MKSPVQNFQKVINCDRQLKKRCDYINNQDEDTRPSKCVYNKDNARN